MSNPTGAPARRTADLVRGAWPGMQGRYADAAPDRGYCFGAGVAASGGGEAAEMRLRSEVRRTASRSPRRAR